MLANKKKMTRTQVIAFGFFCIIAIGTLLLLLPFATREGQHTSILNALFTATSATCVTGLVVYDTFVHWTLFGQLVILLMIQIGGLGFISIGVYAMRIMKKKIGLGKRELIHDSVNSLHVGGSVRLVRTIILGTLLFEGMGAIGLTICFLPDMGILKSIYYGVFHSVSAFCNAGFDLMGYQTEYQSLCAYQGHIGLNVIIILLIIVGGIGFVVWDDLKRKKLHIKKYHFHTKVVLSTTIILIFGGALLFYLMEQNQSLQGLSTKNQILSSLFASVTPRTAGFNTLDVAKYSGGGKFLTTFLMFIGGSPGSTAGGIKTTTLTIIIFFTICNIRNRKSSNLFHRRFEEDAVRKASTVFFINLLLAVTAIVIICTVQVIPLEDAILEVFSAIGTVGMSTGITREMGIVARIVLIFLMYCGRLGSLSFAIAFTERRLAPPIVNPTGKVAIG